MRIFNIFFLVLFIFSAAVQYNDPDPYVWIPIYLCGAYICYLALTDRYYPMLCSISLTIYAVYALYLFVDVNGVWSWWSYHGAESLVQSMKAETPWIEEAREFFGLLLLIIAVAANMVWLKKRRPAGGEALEYSGRGEMPS
jgi:hypothetical protein